MYVLEILDNWAKLQEAEGSSGKSRFVRMTDGTGKTEKVIKHREFLRNSALIKKEKCRFKEPV
ncbi:MAG: hypothetical protein ACTSSA_05565 [Candidatus Freyarchaeota archaeon]